MLSKPVEEHMKKFVFGVLFAVVVAGGAVVGQAQGRVDTSSMRDRQRARQRAIEDPNNNPIKLEPYEPLKPPPPPEPTPLRATVELKVVNVEDGDTLIISNTAGQHLRLRLQGIDAPETGQSFWSDARNHLHKLSAGKSVAVEFDPRGKPDSKGRVVAKVYLDGTDIALVQVKSGFAWFCKDYKKMQTESDRYTYAEAEKEARLAGLGLWSEKYPKAPWEFRKQ